MADRRALEARLRAIERQMQTTTCMFSKKYRDLEKERQKLLRLLGQSRR